MIVLKLDVSVYQAIALHTQSVPTYKDIHFHGASLQHP